MLDHGKHQANTAPRSGIPPIWIPPRFPPALNPDIGNRYVDQNADRNPGSPLESLISAINNKQPSFDFSTINIITDRSPIRKLFGFVNGEDGQQKYSRSIEFRFGIQVMDNGTALFTRLEQQTRQGVTTDKNRRVQGYRQAFEENYTKIAASARGSTSHHRIVSYRFGGLSFLVRYAVDAYLQDHVGSCQYEGIEENGVDALIEYHKAISLIHPAPTGNNPFKKRVIVLTGGRELPHSATLELATRKSTTPFDLNDRLPDLWISQTPHFITCRYRVEHVKRSPKARFDDIKLTDVKSRLGEWEDANAGSLKKLVSVLNQLLTAARGMKGPCIVSFTGEESAQIMISEAHKGEIPSLSPKTKALFDMKVKSAE